MTRGPICIAVTGAIGLTTEAVAAAKKSSARKHDGMDHPVIAHNSTARDGEEVHRAKVNGVTHPKLTADTLKTLTIECRPEGLRMPVIIPQRRPRSRRRGFMRAYAPNLGACQIDQEMLFAFMDGFDESIKKQGLFIVANMAVGAAVISTSAVFGHNPFVDIAAFAIHSVVEAGRRMYITHKYNKYLHDMNEHFFQPRGLYALIMAWNPKSHAATEIYNMETQVALSASKGGDTGSKFKVNSGSTRHDFEMPEAAPLIFPDPADQDDEDEDKNVFQKMTGFLDNYGDRKAQAEFAFQNPTSTLAHTSAPIPQFSSRYADPNHAVNKGGPLAVLTGGKVSPIAQWREHQEKANLAKGRPADEGVGGIRSGLIRLVREDVLYLMIVNMPSKEDLARAAEIAERYQQQEF